MRTLCLLPLAFAVACTSPNAGLDNNGGSAGSNSGGSAGSGSGGAGGTGSGGSGGSNSGGSTVTGGGNNPSALLTFAVFGDSRPPNDNDTSGYPSTIISGIFSQAQSKGAQFMLGTGDYMFASTQSAVTAQMKLFLQAQSMFSGPVYHTMGNHECTGYTDSNCPNGTETPNVQAFMQNLVPKGIATPYYRVDVPTPMGKAKFLFVAANAWSTAQQSWLEQQLADATTYTFLVRHEPPGETQAPGVGPTDTIIQGATYTMAFYGHSHEYRKLGDKSVISGNGGAPLAGSGSGQNYGFLLVEQQSDGTLQISEIDEAGGSVTDSWKITATGASAP